ncbi:MAG: Fe2+-dependent dioxygenase [Pseudomonadota bacterium]
MSILVNNVLDVHSLSAICAALEDLSLYQDGKKTAGKTARLVKHNLQADPKSSVVIGARKMVEQLVRDNSAVKRAAYPEKFAKVMFSRYEPGMNYGAHIDDAIIAGTRTDLSFTLFLSEPDSYQGGELVLQKSDGEDSIKLPAGALFLYPSDTVHYVAPVTSGVRLAAVGWIKSRIRLAEHREILFDMSNALAQLPDSSENQALRLSLLKVKNNLLRLWAD